MRDLIVMGAIGFPLYLLAVWYDALDLFLVYTNEPQSDAIDWLVILFVFLGVAAKIYSVRRTIDLQREVVARRKAQAEAHQMARHDVLTGLPNRRRFIEDFNGSVEHLPPGAACAMFVLDLDNFKPINDVYGHRLGDEVLKVISRRLTELAGGASVARLGGDEFGVTLQYQVGSDAPERLARQIVHELSRPIQLAALSLQVGASVGVATCDKRGSGDTDLAGMAVCDNGAVETMLRRADMAMYWAKADGRGRYRFFDRSMDEKLRQRVELELQIGGAITLGQIVPYYQRIVRLETGETIGFEVLARWVHPKRGVLTSDVFIAIAEDTGTIGKMTDLLIERAMRDAKDWPAHLSVSVNFSPRQISDPNVATRILGLLTKVGFPPHRLVMEITEGAVVQKLEAAKAVLQSLRNVGVRIALDDFGTGYSGLYHLRELELDIVKIDRSFVGEILNKPEEARIVKAMLSLGHALGLMTTAEGIETEEVRQHLLKLGCDAGQGYLFGAPEPAAMVTSASQGGDSRPPHRLAGRQHHHHLPAFEPWLGFHLGDGRGVLLDPLEQLGAELHMRHLAAPEAQGDLHLVALLEEPPDRAHLHLVVVDVDVRPHLDLLDLDGALLLARLGGLFLRLIFVLAVIQDLAHRRLGIGRDLDQIEPGFNRARQGLGRGNHADIVAGSVDELDVGNVDALVDARAALFGGKLRRPSYDVAFSSV